MLRTTSPASRPASAAPTRSPCCPSTRRSGCRTPRPPDRPQHPRPAGRGVQPGPGDRPGRRLLVRRAPHRPARGQAAWAWFQEIERAGGLRGRAGGRADRRPARGQPGRRAGTTRPAPRADHRRQRVPADRRDPAQQARRRPPGRRGRRTAPRPLVAVARGAARPRRRPRAATGVAADGLPGRRSARPPRTTARARFAANLFQAGGIEPSHDAGAGATPPARVAPAAFDGRAAPAVACLCSQRTTPTPSRRAAVAAALQAAGATVVVAGRASRRRRCQAPQRRIIDDMDVLAFCGRCSTRSE